MPKPRRNWIQEERRKTLGDYVSFCLGCGSVWRYFLEREGELAGGLPALRRRDAAPVPRVLGAVPVRVRDRVRGVRCGGPAAGGARRPDPQARPLEHRADDLREADHRHGLVLRRRAGCRAARGSAPSRPDAGSPGCRARSRAARARRSASPRPCRSPRRRSSPAARSGRHEHGDDHPFLVLPGFVAEPDRGRLPVRAQLVGDQRRVEVESEHGHGRTIIRRRARVRPSLARLCTRAASAPRRSEASAPRRSRSSIPGGRTPMRPPVYRSRKKLTILKTRTPRRV